MATNEAESSTNPQQPSGDGAVTRDISERYELLMKENLRMKAEQQAVLKKTKEIENERKSYANAYKTQNKDIDAVLELDLRTHLGLKPEDPLPPNAKEFKIHVTEEPAGAELLAYMKSKLARDAKAKEEANELTLKLQALTEENTKLKKAQGGSTGSSEKKSLPNQNGSKAKLTDLFSKDEIVSLQRGVNIKPSSSAPARLVQGLMASGDEEGDEEPEGRELTWRERARKRNRNSITEEVENPDFAQDPYRAHVKQNFSQIPNNPPAFATGAFADLKAIDHRLPADIRNSGGEPYMPETNPIDEPAKKRARYLTASNS